MGTRATQDRRDFIQAVTAAPACLLGYAGHPPANPVAPKPQTASGALSALVLNPRTNVIHHQKACARHLPRNGKPGATLPADLKRLHNGGVFILETMAAEALARKDFDGAIALLRRALVQRPSALHVYDKLVRIYGRLRRYNEIHTLLNTALSDPRLVKMRPILEERSKLTLYRRDRAVAERTRAPKPKSPVPEKQPRTKKTAGDRTPRPEAGRDARRQPADRPDAAQTRDVRPVENRSSTGSSLSVLAGTWESELGPVTLQVQGAAVHGFWTDRSGGRGNISNGFLSGTDLHLEYVWPGGQRGTASFAWNPRSRRWEGNWKHISGAMGAWNLGPAKTGGQ